MLDNNKFHTHVEVLSYEVADELQMRKDHVDELSQRLLRLVTASL